MEGDDHTDKVGANEWGVFSQSLWRGIAPIPRWRTRLDRVPSPTALRWQTGEVPLSDGWIRQVRDVGTMAGSRHRMVRTLASLWRTYQVISRFIALYTLLASMCAYNAPRVRMDTRRVVLGSPMDRAACQEYIGRVPSFGCFLPSCVSHAR